MAINIIGGILYFIGAYLIAKNNPLIRDFSKHITEQDIRREAFSLQGGHNFSDYRHITKQEN